MARIGVLALQGGFAPHRAKLVALGHEAVEIRDAAAVDGLAGMVLPGGESTAQLRLLEGTRLEPALCEFAAQGRPVLATCAGLVLCASRVVGRDQRCLGLLDVDIERNAFGPQLESFEARCDDDARELVFIRAPRIARVGPGVEVLARFRGEPVLVRQGSVVGAAYHPELVPSDALHAAVFGAMRG